MPKSPLRWAGGKGKLLPELKKFMPTDYEIYAEIFSGGASVFFNLNPENTILIDTNEELINFYKVLRDKPKKLIEELKDYRNEKEFYLRIRALENYRDVV